MADSAPPRSVWSRSSKLLKLAAGLAQKEAAGRIARAFEKGEELAHRLHTAKVQVEQAREIVEHLGQLKGAAMKAGQLLSMELRDVLPPEVVEILSKLQDSGNHVGFSEIRSILKDELGDELLSQLEVQEAPLASASIGQVHLAHWNRPDGTREAIVLKVQFRGIADTIESDLAVLEKVARLFLAMQLKDIEVSGAFDELKAVLVRETDYEAEAEALERYRAKAADLAGVRVPRCFRELSTKRVLALSYESGVKVDAFLSTNPSREDREHFAHVFLDLYFREFFDWGLVQTDANFANFLFRPSTRELVVLDFGATRDYPQAFRDDYRALILSSYRRDEQATYEAAIRLGLIDPTESEAARRALFVLLESVLCIFRDEQQPYDFADRKHTDAAAEALKAFYKTLKRGTAPAQLIFLHRKLAGVHAMGKALGAKMDLRVYWRRLESDERRAA